MIERSCPSDTVTTAAPSRWARSTGRVDQRTQHREPVEVDADQLEPCPATDGRVAIDELAVGERDEHLANHSARFVGALAQDTVVEHSLGQRDRQDLLRAEPDGVAEQLRIVDSRDFEHADADAVAGDAEPHVPLRQLVLLEEDAQRRGERVRVAQLARDDDTAIERRARDTQHFRRDRRSERGRQRSVTRRS